MAVNRIDYGDKALRVRSLEVIEDLDGGAVTSLITKIGKAEGGAEAIRAKFLSFIDDIASDSRITPPEKIELKRKFADITAEKPIIIGRAAAVGMGDADPYVVDYYNSYTALYNYLYVNPNILNPAAMAVSDDIVGSELTLAWETYIAKREELLSQISLIFPKFQYSADGSNWHDSWTTGDIYMRTSTDNGQTWGNSIRIVGEAGQDGQYTNYMYSKNTSATTAPAHTPDADSPGAAWADSPAEISSGEFLWMTKSTWQGSTRLSVWSTPVRISGEEGAAQWTPIMENGVTKIGPAVFRKSGGQADAWNGTVYSKEGFPACTASAQVESLTNRIMFGLASVPATGSSYYAIDFAWYFNGPSGICSVYNGSSKVGDYGAITTDTVLSVTWDGYVAKFYKDGALKTTVTGSSGVKYFDSSFYDVNALSGLKNVRFVASGRAGENTVSAVLSNEAHAFPASTAGAVSSYANSGTTIKVFEGAVELTYDGAGTSYGTWKFTTAATNITCGGITDSGTYATVADHSGLADGNDTAKIVYTITGKTSQGVTFTVTKEQTFTKSKTGATGATGPTGPQGPQGPDSPRYLGKYYASHPSSYLNGDWWLVYDSDDSPIQRGVWYSNAGTPSRITTSSSAALQGKLVAALADIAWVEKNGYGTASAYGGFDAFFTALGAVSAYISELFSKNITATGFIQSSNYAENANGDPTAGFKLRASDGVLLANGARVSGILKTSRIDGCYGIDDDSYPFEGGGIKSTSSSLTFHVTKPVSAILRYVSDGTGDGGYASVRIRFNSSYYELANTGTTTGTATVAVILNPGNYQLNTTHISGETGTGYLYFVGIFGEIEATSAAISRALS